ncbi:tyrosine-type recombinase/integrase [Amycolatopsis sp. WGS_07]|uniref:tyrosine-type recombinase/integrase n=1 Tax=Amycolatopsis sp. WGS_07 TaxID=3076764 RepID=UPI00387341E4
MTAVEAPLEVLEPDDIRELVSDWRTHLRAKNRADSTIDAYLDSMAMLVNYLDDEDISMVAPDIGRRELERYFEYLRQRPNFRTGESLSHSYIAKQYRHLQQFWRWLDDVEEIVELSPFYKMEVPHVPDNPPTVLREKELKALLATTKGKGFVELRDRAIILVLVDCGVRVGELSLLTVANPAEQERGSFVFDVDVVRVLGKGRRVRDVPFNPATAEAGRGRPDRRRRPRDRLRGIHDANQKTGAAGVVELASRGRAGSCWLSGLCDGGNGEPGRSGRRAGFERRQCLARARRAGPRRLSTRPACGRVHVGSGRWCPRGGTGENPTGLSGF